MERCKKETQGSVNNLRGFCYDGSRKARFVGVEEGKGRPLYWVS